MLVLNDPAAQLSSVEGKAAASAAPVTNLSAFASSNDIVVKVCCVCVWLQVQIASTALTGWQTEKPFLPVHC